MSPLTISRKMEKWRFIKEVSVLTLISSGKRTSKSSSSISSLRNSLIWLIGDDTENKRETNLKLMKPIWKETLKAIWKQFVINLKPIWKESWKPIWNQFEINLKPIWNQFEKKLWNQFETNWKFNFFPHLQVFFSNWFQIDFKLISNWFPTFFSNWFQIDYKLLSNSFQSFFSNWFQ